jgi:hypothetical protein
MIFAHGYSDVVFPTTKGNRTLALYVNTKARQVLVWDDHKKAVLHNVKTLNRETIPSEAMPIATVTLQGQFRLEGETLFKVLGFRVFTAKERKQLAAGNLALEKLLSAGVELEVYPVPASS